MSGVAPGIVLLGTTEESGKVDDGGGVKVTGDVVTHASHSQGFEEAAAMVLATAAAAGESVKVEDVVAGLHELAVADDLGTEMGIDRVEESGPIVTPRQLSPTPRQLSDLLFLLLHKGGDRILGGGLHGKG